MKTLLLMPVMTMVPSDSSTDRTSFQHGRLIGVQ